MSSPDWRGLFELGAAFRALAPWQWMHDGHVFGVRDQDSERIGWCVVLGSAGQLEGFSAYLGDAGFDTYRSIQEREEIAPLDFWGQDALVLLFGDREEVSAKQRALIKQQGLRFRGRGAWPAITEHRVGYLPRDIPPGQVPFMHECLRQGLAVAERLRADPEYVWLDEDGRLLVVSGEQVERVPEPAPPPEPPAPRADQLELGRLRARYRHSQLILEMSVFPFLGTAVDSPEGPYMPAVALAVDARTGIVLGQSMDEPNRRDLITQQLLAKTIKETGTIPRAVRVTSPSTARALDPIAAGLDVALELAKALPMLEQARDSMLRFFGGGPR